MSPFSYPNSLLVQKKDVFTIFPVEEDVKGLLFIASEGLLDEVDGVRGCQWTLKPETRWLLEFSGV